MTFVDWGKRYPVHLVAWFYLHYCSIVTWKGPFYSDRVLTQSMYTTRAHASMSTGMTLNAFYCITAPDEMGCIFGNLVVIHSVHFSTLLSGKWKCVQNPLVRTGLRNTSQHPLRHFLFITPMWYTQAIEACTPTCSHDVVIALLQVLSWLSCLEEDPDLQSVGQK